MAHPTAVLAEDEAVLRGELRAHLADLWPELRIVGEACNGFQALQLLERHAPDLLFLDIEMPGLTGLEVARQAGERCHVVFVTAYDAHATAAFEQGAIDYVLKPYSLDRLALTVRRLRQRIGSAAAPLDSLLRQLAGAARPQKYLRWINAAHGNDVALITVDEVLYFQADTRYTLVVTAAGEALIRRPLKELQDELDPANFWPIHRSTIVNANAIAGVTRDFRGRIHVKLKARADRLPVSEAHAHLFRQM
ncbi:MAG: transcriptional regulator [Ramlibacter sp.]|nr:transcriptional regulator [Ramlibacter sp.]